MATPREEIVQAVAANTTTDISEAQPKKFLRAFNAVAFRVQPRALPDYVIAAINLRPDLASKIVAVAVKSAVKNFEAKPHLLCAIVEGIVKAAITANPDAAVAIVEAGASASPQQRQCVADAALAVAPEASKAIIEAARAKTLPFAFLTFSASAVDGFSFTPATLNPANIFAPVNDGSVLSPEQPPSH
jgi:hypothetical protein